MDEYVVNLEGIIDSWAKKLERRISTVYFGGGTPSLIGEKRLISILDKVKNSFELVPDAEITVEMNPSSSSTIDFKSLKEAGFNRISIGLQSSDDKELKKLGRRHKAVDAENTVKHAKEAGFDNISFDIMLAIPGQTLESLERTIEFCAGLDVRHISSYILKLEEGTRFYIDRDKLPALSDDEQADFYEFAVRRLSEFGFEQYEISNFSKPGYESRHNLIYWRDEEYLGLGPSAHSFIDGKRFFYDRSFDGFYADETVFESDGGDKNEFIMLALRLREGLVFERYKERFNEEVSEKLISAAKNLSVGGFVKICPTSVSLTEKGFLVSNSIIAYLLQNT